jgi:hypothetical protein
VAAACGLRAFLPLFVVGLAGRFGAIELEPAARWLAGTPALVCFGTATVVEVLGDKIPVVDHALDVVGSVLRPLAAWLGAYAVLTHWPTPLAGVIALGLGGAALGVHAAKAKLRIGSSALTLGHANPLLSIAEDGVSGALVAAAVLAPLLVLLAAFGLAVLLLRRRAPRPRPAR